MKKRAEGMFKAMWAVLLLMTFLIANATASVVKDGNKTFLVDRTGERWDISQAVSIGFDPHHFEFGIGRYAFNPLDDSHWQEPLEHLSPGMRVIGVAEDGEAHAYSVRKLSYHETANTFLGSKAIVASY